MKKPFLQKDTLEKWAAAILILVAAALSFLPLVGSAGYYRDDWHVLWGSVEQGAAGIIDQHTLDRPLMGVIYAGVDMILGHQPLAWQLFALGVRILGAWVFLWLLRSIWKDQKLPTLVIALFFVIYPGFFQQGNANTYQNHLLAILFGLLSIFLTIRFSRARSTLSRCVLLGLSILSGLACYMMFEWMVGLEGLRLLLLWVAQSDPERDSFRRRARRFLPTLLPNLGAAGIFLIWRLVFFKSARSVTDTGALFRRYLANPGENLLRIFVESLKDVFEASFSAWFTPFYQLSGSVSIRETFTGLVLAAAAVCAFLVYLKYFHSDQSGLEKNDTKAGSTFKPMVWIGVIAVLVSVLPPILAERHIEFRDGLDRYSLTAMAGAAILAAGLIFTYADPACRKWLAAALLGIGVLTQFSGMVYFKNFWNYERQLWWQLSWRAPDLKDNTAVIPLLPSGYRLAEGYEVWGPANLIYRPGVNKVAISGDALNNQNILYLINGLNLGRSMRKVEYTVDYKNSLVMSLPAAGSCLHVLNGEKPEISLDDDPLIRLAGGYSKISMIQAEGRDHRPPEDIFGQEPSHGWCYYYQKASLARQLGDWEEVTRLGDEAAAEGLDPQDISEWLPFYEGYVHLWKYEQADRIAGMIRLDHFFTVDYCRNFRGYTPDENAADQVDQFIVENLCGHLDAIK